MDRRRAAPTIITINDIVVNQRPGMVNLDACRRRKRDLLVAANRAAAHHQHCGRSDLPPILR